MWEGMVDRGSSLVEEWGGGGLDKRSPLLFTHEVTDV